MNGKGAQKKPRILKKAGENTRGSILRQAGAGWGRSSARGGWIRFQP